MEEHYMGGDGAGVELGEGCKRDFKDYFTAIKNDFERKII